MFLFSRRSPLASASEFPDVEIRSSRPSFPWREGFERPLPVPRLRPVVRSSRNNHQYAKAMAIWEYNGVYVYIYIYIYTYNIILPVVPHKAVAEVSKIGNL